MTLGLGCEMSIDEDRANRMQSRREGSSELHTEDMSSAEVTFVTHFDARVDVIAFNS